MPLLSHKHFRHFKINHWITIAVVALTLLIASACAKTESTIITRLPDRTTVEKLSTPSPIQEPTSQTTLSKRSTYQTVTSSPTVVPNSTAGDVLDVNLLFVPACNPRPIESRASGGTIPHPTPTHAPISSDLSENIGAANLYTYTKLAGPILESAGHWLSSLDRRWPQDSTIDDTNRQPVIQLRPDHKAALIREIGERFRLICDAVALLNVPPAGLDAWRALVELVEAHDKWARLYALALRDGSDLDKAPLQNKRQSITAAFKAATQAHKAVEIAASQSLDVSPLTIRNERTGIEVNILPGWFVTRLDFQTVLVAPGKLQIPGFVGLGQGASIPGTTLSVRRLRNPNSYSLREAIQAVRESLDPESVIASEYTVDVAGHEGRHLAIKNSASPEWSVNLALIVVENHTFFFEIQCPVSLVKACKEALSTTLLHANLSP